MSLHDVAQPLPPSPEQVAAPACFDEISSPISASRIFEFCDPELFTETMHGNSDQSSYAASLCFPLDLDERFGYKVLGVCKLQADHQPDNATTTTTTTTSSSTTTVTSSTSSIIANDPFTLTPNNNNLSVLFHSQEEIDDDISASIDFSPSPPFPAAPYPGSIQNGQLDYSSHIPVVAPLGHYPLDTMLPLLASSQLPPLSEQDCLSAIPSFLHLNPQAAASCYSFLDPGHLNGAFSDGSYTGFFTGTLLGGQETEAKDVLHYQRDNTGILCHDNMSSAFSSGDLQPLSNKSQQTANGAASSTPTGLENSIFKVGKLSAEERKEKIHRYKKKRNKRDFSKKIKYACRKTLADSRPRVRGRFAKNDEFGESHRHIGGHYQEDDYDEVSTVKEEDVVVDATDIYAHIGKPNSFKCGYPIQYWI